VSIEPPGAPEVANPSTMGFCLAISAVEGGHHELRAAKCSPFTRNITTVQDPIQIPPLHDEISNLLTCTTSANGVQHRRGYDDGYEHYRMHPRYEPTGHLSKYKEPARGTGYHVPTMSKLFAPNHPRLDRMDCCLIEHNSSFEWTHPEYFSGVITTKIASERAKLPVELTHYSFGYAHQFLMETYP
jgi:hypothetical protein